MEGQEEEQEDNNNNQQIEEANNEGQEYQEENVFANDQFEGMEQINIEEASQEQNDENEALFLHNGRPSEIISKIEHQEEYMEPLEEEVVTQQVDIVVEEQVNQGEFDSPHKQPSTSVLNPQSPALNRDLPLSSVSVDLKPQGMNMTEMTAQIKEQYNQLQTRINNPTLTVPHTLTIQPGVYAGNQSPPQTTISYEDTSMNRTSNEGAPSNQAVGGAYKGKSRLAKMILNDIDEYKLPTAEEVQKDSVNSYALLLKEENEKKLKKKREMEALERKKREAAFAAELKKMTPQQRQLELLKIKQKKQAAERRRQMHKSPEQQEKDKRSNSPNQVVERLYASKKDRDRDEKKAQSRALVIAKLNSSSPTRGANDHIQYNVIPLKDFAFEDHQNPSTFTQTFSFMRNQYERTDHGGIRNDIKYVKTMKYKKDQKKRFDFEFDDLKVKKETQYDNPLYEQTRKIFLNDLDELKKKIKGRQYRMMQNRTMSPTDENMSSTQIGSSYTLNGGYYGGGTHGNNSRQTHNRVFTSVYKDISTPQENQMRGPSTAQTVLSGQTAKFPLSNQGSQVHQGSGKELSRNASHVQTLLIREFTGSNTISGSALPLEQFLMQSQSAAQLNQQQNQNSTKILNNGSHSTSQHYLSNPQIMVEISSNQQQQQVQSNSKHILSNKQSSHHNQNNPQMAILSSHHLDDDVYHSETGQAFYLTEPPILLNPPAAFSQANLDQEIGPFTSQEKTPLTIYTNFNKKQHAIQQHYESTKVSLSNDLNLQRLDSEKKQMSLPDSPHLNHHRPLLTTESASHIVDQNHKPLSKLASKENIQSGIGSRQQRHNSQKQLQQNINSHSFLNEGSEEAEEQEVKLSGQYNTHQSQKDSIESMQVVLHPMHSGVLPYESQKLSNATSNSNINSPGFFFQKDARQPPINPYHQKKQVSGAFPKIEKSVTIMVPTAKPPLHSSQSRNAMLGLQKNLRNTPTMSNSLKKNLLPTMNNTATLAIMADPQSSITGSSQTIVVPHGNTRQMQFHQHYTQSRSNSNRGRRRKSPTEGTVPGESTNQFMGHGLKSIGVLQPLIVDRKFELQARNYPHKELYQTIPTRKFKVNGVKVVDRYNHMKKQIFDFIKNHNSYSSKSPKQKTLIPMVADNSQQQNLAILPETQDQYALVPV